jgi:hypothetical protein
VVVRLGGRHLLLLLLALPMVVGCQGGQHGESASANVDDDASADDDASSLAPPADAPDSLFADISPPAPGPPIRNDANWCERMSQLPPEAGWRWDSVVLGSWDWPVSVWPYLAFSGDTLHAVWQAKKDEWGRGLFYVGRWEDGNWEQWEVIGLDDPIVAIAGAAVDSAGRLWTTLWDPQNLIYDTACSLVRWDADQIVEAVPVMDTYMVDFAMLFILPDDRFAFTYLDGGYQDSMVMETTSGGFVKADVPATIWVAPGPDGVFHGPMVGPGGLLWDQVGNPTEGFAVGIVGRLPLGVALGEGYASVDASGVTSFSVVLADYRLWLISYLGHDIQAAPWPGLDTWHAWESFAAASDPLGRPYGFIGMYGDAPPNNCFFRQEPGGVRIEPITLDLKKYIGYWPAFAANALGGAAAAGTARPTDGVLALQLVIRHSTKGGSHVQE